MSTTTAPSLGTNTASSNKTGFFGAFLSRIRKNQKKEPVPMPPWRIKEKAAFSHFAELRHRMRKLVTIMAIQPVIGLLIFNIAQEALVNTGMSRVQASLLASAIGLMVFIVPATVLWLVGTFSFERCFFSLSKQERVASEQISRDDINMARNATSALFDSWLDRILLSRWVRDMRFTFVLASTLVSVLVMGLSVIFSNYATPEFFNPIATLFSFTLSALSVVRAIMFSNALMRMVNRFDEVDAPERIAERFDKLIGEVIELRRGVRV